MAKILAVLRDITPANYLLAIYPLLRSQHEVHFMFDEGGVGHKAFAKMTITVVGQSTSINDYDLVIVGCSTSCTLEALKAFEAKAVDIPSVAICDLRGAQARHGDVHTDYYLAYNRWAADLLQYGTYRIVGDINASPLPEVPSDAAYMIRQWQAGAEVVFWLAQSDIETLEIILERLQPGQKLLCGLHPDPKKWPDQDRIKKVLEELGGDRMAVVADIAPGISSIQALAALDTWMTVAVTGYSGAGTTAAYNGYRVATADGPQIRRAYGKSNPLAAASDTFLLPYMVNSPVVTRGSSENLFGLSYWKNHRVRQVLRPFDPHVATQAIEELLR